MESNTSTSSKMKTNPKKLFYFILLSTALHWSLWAILSFSKSSVVHQQPHKNVSISVERVEGQLRGSHSPHPKKKLQPTVSKTNELKKNSSQTPTIKSPSPGIKTPESISSSESGPVLQTPIDPVYPDFARDNEMEGEVLVLVTISKEGIVTQTKILESSGFKVLDQSAQKAIREAQFAPAQEDGQKLSSTTKIRVKFTLDENS